MMIPICTGSISVASLILLALCSPISDVLLRCAALPEDGEIFMVNIPVAKCAEPSNLRATRSWGQSTSWSMIQQCWNSGTSRRNSSCTIVVLPVAGLPTGIPRTFWYCDQKGPVSRSGNWRRNWWIAFSSQRILQDASSRTHEVAPVKGPVGAAFRCHGDIQSDQHELKNQIGPNGDFPAQRKRTAGAKQLQTFHLFPLDRGRTTDTSTPDNDHQKPEQGHPSNHLTASFFWFII